MTASFSSPSLCRTSAQAGRSVPRFSCRQSRLSQGFLRVGGQTVAAQSSALLLCSDCSQFAVKEKAPDTAERG